MQIIHETKISNDVIDCLMETANLDYTSREGLAACEAIFVRENGIVIFALAFEVFECPHGRELQVSGINGKRAKGFQWVKIALEKLDEILIQNDIPRMTFMVESNRVRQLLDRIGGFMPLATMMGRMR